jgi:hypothetical protein
MKKMIHEMHKMMTQMCTDLTIASKEWGKSKCTSGAVIVK